MLIAYLRDRAIDWGTCASLLLAVLLSAIPGYAAGPGSRGAPFGSVIAAADLDGDRRLDMVTAGASRGDGPGYLLDISIQLNGVDAGAITVRTSSIAGRLFARDMDGDADRDLVLESFDSEPLAVILNDGGGHFHQGNLNDFRARLRRPDSRTIEVPSDASDAPDTGECPTGSAGGPPRPAAAPDSAATHAPALPEECFVELPHSVWATRGPPASR